MDDDFSAIRERAKALRMSENELAERSGVSRTRLWRSKRAGDTTRRLRTIRQLELALDLIEALPEVCATCSRRKIDPATWACTAADCGLSLKQDQAA